MNYSNLLRQLLCIFWLLFFCHNLLICIPNQVIQKSITIFTTSQCRLRLLICIFWLLFCDNLLICTLNQVIEKSMTIFSTSQHRSKFLVCIFGFCFSPQLTHMYSKSSHTKVDNYIIYTPIYVMDDGRLTFIHTKTNLFCFYLHKEVRVITNYGLTSALDPDPLNVNSFWRIWITEMRPIA